MKEVNILGKGAVCRFPGHLFGYTAWPSIEMLPDGTLIAVASGMRMGHLCFCGKTVMYVSRDGGNTWAGPTVINDTPLDDRDAGILWLGGRKLLLTWFNLETKYLAAYRGARDEMTPQQRAIVDAMTLHYSDAVDEKWAGSFCRLSEDGGVTWKEPHRLPVTAPHGPARLRDGRLLILGKDFKNKEPSGDGGAIYACASSDEGVTWETLSSIPLPNGTHNNNYFEPHVIELPDGKLVGHIRYQHWAAYHKFQPFTIFQTESARRRPHMDRSKAARLLRFPAAPAPALVRRARLHLRPARSAARRVGNGQLGRRQKLAIGLRHRRNRPIRRPRLSRVGRNGGSQHPDRVLSEAREG